MESRGGNQNKKNSKKKFRSSDSSCDDTSVSITISDIIVYLNGTLHNNWPDYQNAIVPSERFTNLGATVSFIDALGQASKAKEQIKIIQSTKKILKTSLVNSFIDNLPSSNQETRIQWIDEFEILLFVYLYPLYSPLKASLEWVVELLTELYSLAKTSNSSKALLLQSVRRVCTHVLKACLQLENNFFKDEVDKFLQIVPSFISMSLLHKDIIPWMQVDSPDEEDGILIDFISSLSDILCRVLENIGGNEKYSEISQESESSATAVEVVRESDCCNELLRAIVAVLKGWKWTYPAPRLARSAEWTSIADRTITAICNTLKRGLVGKDATTNLALGGVVFQLFITSMLESSVPSRAFYQLLASSCLLFFPSEESNERNRLTPLLLLSHFSGLHPSWVKLLPILPLISKMAVLRACLSIFDDTSLTLPLRNDESSFAEFVASTDMSSVDLIKWSPHQLCIYDVNSLIRFHISELNSIFGSKSSSSLLFGPFLAFLLQVCSNPSPTIQLYGLQTMESWLSRVSDCYSDTAVVDCSIYSIEEIRQLLHNLEKLARVLSIAWNHPARQVKWKFSH